MDELYGKKVGVKHPKSVKAEMMKDTIAAWILYGVGVGVIMHMHALFIQEYKEI